MSEVNGKRYHGQSLFSAYWRMAPKLIVVALLIAIVVALILGGIFLVKDPSTSRRTVKALSWRVGLQVALILFLILAFFMGWLQPHAPGAH